MVRTVILQRRVILDSKPMKFNPVGGCNDKTNMRRSSTSQLPNCHSNRYSQP